MQTLCSEKEKCSSLVAGVPSAIMKTMLFCLWGQRLPFHSCCLLFLSSASEESHPLPLLLDGLNGIYFFFCGRSKISSLLMKERTFCSRSPHMSCILQSRLYRIPSSLVKMTPLGLRGYESSGLFTWKSSYSLANGLVGAQGPLALGET